LELELQVLLQVLELPVLLAQEQVRALGPELAQELALVLEPVQALELGPAQERV
jgi:hypothetical protein